MNCCSVGCCRTVLTVLVGVVALAFVYRLFFGLHHRWYTQFDHQAFGEIRRHFVAPPPSHFRHKYETPFVSKFNLNTKTDRMASCEWLEEQPLYLPDEDDFFERMLITWLNEFNVTYTLADGALLGAYRHHGKIPDDYDVDVGFPHWLNFDCSRYVQQLRKPQRHEQRQLEDELCGKDFVMAKFEERNLATGNLFIVERKHYGIRLYERNPKTKIRSHYVDISIGPGWRKWFVGGSGRNNNDTNNDPPTCKCWYRTIPAQCVHDALRMSMHTYKQTKEEILTPMVFSNQNKGARNAFTDRSLKNPLHPRWRQPDS